MREASAVCRRAMTSLRISRVWCLVLWAFMWQPAVQAFQAFGGETHLDAGEGTLRMACTPSAATSFEVVVPLRDGRTLTATLTAVAPVDPSQTGVDENQKKPPPMLVAVVGEWAVSDEPMDLPKPGQAGVRVCESSWPERCSSARTGAQLSIRTSGSADSYWGEFVGLLDSQGPIRVSFVARSVAGASSGQCA